MANADVAMELAQLRDEVASGLMPPEQVPRAFERLAYQLMDIDGATDQRLKDFANDLERTGFSKLPENQAAAMSGILDDAQNLFDARS